jgi:glycosyltransferase involved in cell wall biosynthesis
VRRLLRTSRFALIHSQGIPTGAQVVLANSGLGVPHVMTSHDVFRPVHARGFRGQITLWLLGWLLSQIDTIVTVGDEARLNHLEHLPRLARDPGRVVTINPGIDSRSYAETDQMTCTALRDRFGIAQGTLLVGFLGRFVEQKGFLLLLEALECLTSDPPHMPYHVVAVGSRDYEAEYRREVKRRGLGDLVSFHEFIPDPRAALRELDLLIMPSLWEALPVLPMEAMAVGTPVLGTDCIGLREVLAETPATMVPAGDSRALADSLKNAIENPRLERARRFAPEARRRFDVRASSVKLLERFDRAIVARHKTRLAWLRCIPGKS